MLVVLTQPTATRRANMNESTAQQTQLIASQTELLAELTQQISAQGARLVALEKVIATQAEHKDAELARMAAVITLLRAVYQCVPNPDQVLARAQVLATMAQAQPGYILGNMDGFHAMKECLDWMAAPFPEAGQ